MSFTVPSRRIAALAVAASGLSAVLAGAFAPAATAAPSSSPTVTTVSAKASSWFVDPRTPAQRKAEVAVPKNPKKYAGKVKETRAVYRTRSGDLAVPMRYAFGHKVESGQAVTLDGEGLFVVNTVKLTSNAKTQLRRLGEALDNAASIRCEGYADYAGTAKRNVTLARGRAEAVCDAMAAQNQGLKATTVGYGPTWPAVIGGDSEARRLNRRVVVEVTNAKPVTPPAPQAKVPGPPVLEEIQSHGGIVGFAYSKPASDGGSPITGYEVSFGDGWAPVDSEVPQFPAASPSACLADCSQDDYLYGFLYDLPVGSTADVRVRAVNKVGAGAPSNTLSTVVEGVPTPVPSPYRSEYYYMNGTLWTYVFFTTVPDAVGYEAQLDDGSWLPISVEGGDSSSAYGTVADPVCAAVYSCSEDRAIKVRAVYAGSTGVASESFPVTAILD